MKVLDTGLFAATLVLVPALAWLIGRALGRRDWQIASVLVTGCFVALIPHALRVVVQAAAGNQPFWDALPDQAARTLDNPEVGLFFVTLGVFMTMLGWTATPVAQPRPHNGNGAG